jgi:hypothetical protein
VTDYVLAALASEGVPLSAVLEMVATPLLIVWATIQEDPIRVYPVLKRPPVGFCRLD